MKLTPWISKRISKIRPDQLKFPTVCFAFLFIFLTPLSYADLDLKDLKDIGSALRPEYRYLSPEFGFELIETGTLENLRFFGNYGPEREELGCFSPALSHKNDCPQDAFAKLIQRLFPSPNGHSLTLNRRTFDLESHLTPRAIGILLAWTAEARKIAFDSEGAWESSRKQLVKDLETEINETISPTEFRRKGFEKRRVELSHALAQEGNPELKTKIRSKIAAFEAALSKIEIEKDVTKKVFKESQYIAFSQLMVAALKEVLNVRNSYSPHWIEQVLTSYFWKRSHQKADVLELFSGMPQFLTDPNLLKSDSKKASFLKNHFELERVPHLSTLSEVEANQLPEPWVTEADELGVLFKLDQRRRSKYPQMISGDQTRHTSLGTEHYPDCGETSIRNFLNLITYDRETHTFDPHNLKRVSAGPGVKVHPALITFYEKYPDLSAALSSTAREDWSNQVISSHAGVRYRRPEHLPQCEMDAGLKNFLKVLDRILFSEPTRLSSSKQLDRLTQLFSRPGFKLSWKVHGSDEKNGVDRTDTGLKIEWIINEVPEFISIFDPMHFAMMPLQRTERRKKIFDILLKKWQSSHLPKIGNPLLWIVSQGAWDVALPHIAASLEHTQPGLLFYSRPLHSPENRFAALRIIPQINTTSAVDLMNRVARRFPSEDFYSQKMICSSFLTHLDTPSSLGSSEEAFFGYFSTSPLKKSALLFCLASMGKVSWLEGLKKHPDLFHLPQDLAVKDPNENTLARVAADSMQFNALRWIARHLPGSLHEGDRYGSTPVHAAALSAPKTFFIWLAETDPGAIAQEDHDHFLPAHAAAHGQNWDLLKWMVETNPQWVKSVSKYLSSPAQVTEEKGNSALSEQIKRTVGE